MKTVSENPEVKLPSGDVLKFQADTQVLETKAGSGSWKNRHGVQIDQFNDRGEYQNGVFYTNASARAIGEALVSLVGSTRQLALKRANRKS